MRVTLLVLLSMILSVGSASAQSAFFSGTLDEAIAASKKQNKVLIVDFYAGWCKPCRQLDKSTMSDSTVQAYVHKYFIMYKLDVDDSIGTTWKSKFHVYEYPTMMFFKPGNIDDTILRIEGYRPPELFLSDLRYLHETHHTK